MHYQAIQKTVKRTNERTKVYIDKSDPKESKAQILDCALFRTNCWNGTAKTNARERLSAGEQPLLSENPGAIVKQERLMLKGGGL